MLWRDLWTEFLHVLAQQSIAEQILFEITWNTGHTECTHNRKWWHQPDTFGRHHLRELIFFFSVSFKEE